MRLSFASEAHGFMWFQSKWADAIMSPLLGAFGSPNDNAGNAEGLRWRRVKAFVSLPGLNESFYEPERRTFLMSWLGEACIQEPGSCDDGFYFFSFRPFVCH